VCLFLRERANHHPCPDGCERGAGATPAPTDASVSVSAALAAGAPPAPIGLPRGDRGERHRFEHYGHCFRALAATLPWRSPSTGSRPCFEEAHLRRRRVGEDM
jgi:hypothetical protein